jgi:hypothetical protein
MGDSDDIHSNAALGVGEIPGSGERDVHDAVVASEVGRSIKVDNWSGTQRVLYDDASGLRFSFGRVGVSHVGSPVNKGEPAA